MGNSLPKEVFSLREKYTPQETENSKVVKLVDAVPKTAEEQAGDFLSNRNYSVDTRLGKFFNSLYQSSIPIKPDSKEFVRWQILLSQTILEGQRYEQFRNNQSPMELAEFLQVGYYGAYCRAKKAGKPAFFDLWLKLALQTIAK